MEISEPTLNVRLIDFFDEGIDYQQRYSESSNQVGPKDYIPDTERYAKLIEYISHLIEEIIEFRQCYPRRPWKKNEQASPKDQALEEFADVLLFIRSVAAYAGFSGSEIEAAFYKKIHKNSQRPDHAR